MKLNDLVGKDVRIEFFDEETSDVVGELYDLDTEANVVHVHIHMSGRDLFVPLYSVKTIEQKF